MVVGKYGDKQIRKVKSGPKCTKVGLFIAKRALPFSLKTHGTHTLSLWPKVSHGRSKCGVLMAHGQVHHLLSRS